MKRLLSALLCIAMIASVCAFCSVAADEVDWQDSGINYTETLESFDTNPGRGWAKYRWYILRKDGEASESVTTFNSGLYCPMFNLAAFSAGNDWQKEGYDSVYPDNAAKVGGTDMEIGKDALAAIEATFAAAEKQGVQLIPRFGYTPEHMVGSEPSELKWILRHIEQVCEIINKYKNTVIAVNCGFIGPWGEMHSSPYSSKPESNAVIKTWLDNLDEQVPLQTRTAGFIMNYANKTNIKLIRELPFSKDHPAYRLGMYNDGYLGTSTDYGTWGSDTMPREWGIQLLKEQASRIAYGGELAYADYDDIVGGSSGDGRSPIFDDGIVEELYNTHLQYLHNIVDGPEVCEILEGLKFAEKHAFEGMPDVSVYYGQSLRKFMHDHMGYRFVIRDAQNLESAGKGGFVKLKGEIENVGFGNLLAPVTAEIIVVAGDGTATYIDSTLDPMEWKTCTTNEYSFAVSVPLDAAAGEYDVYLRFGTLSHEESIAGSPTIRFANDDSWSPNLGANYIGSFTVTEEVVGYATSFKQVNLDFDDVAEGYWGKSYIEQICNMGLMNGVSAISFSPETATTRGQFVTVLYNMEGKPDVSGIDTPFTDVATGRYYTDPVAWAYENEIVNGTTDTTFSPDGKLTREQFATMLYRYAEYKGVDVTARADLSAYEDEADVSNYAKETMSWANKKGFITGMTATTLAPKGQATRAQMATILIRYISDTSGVMTDKAKAALKYEQMLAEAQEADRKLNEKLEAELIKRGLK